MSLQSKLRHKSTSQIIHYPEISSNLQVIPSDIEKIASMHAIIYFVGKYFLACDVAYMAPFIRVCRNACLYTLKRDLLKTSKK